MKPFFYRSLSGNSPVKHGKEAAGQSYKRGAMVTLASGLVALRADTGTSLLGIANFDATGVTNADVEYMPFARGNEFVMSVGHATPASAVITQANVGTAYGLKTDSGTGYAYVDLENTTANQKSVVLVGLFDPASTQYGRGIFTVASGHYPLAD
jgi:hypothetical protein